jgi:hypothetical protein
MGGAGQVRWAENQAVWIDFTFTVSTIQGRSEVDYVEIFLAPHLFGSHSEEQFNPEERVQRPETLRLRGELHLENGQPDLAQADFRDSISLARSMGGEGMGAAHNDEPRAVARIAGFPRQGAHDTRRNLRLLHRGLRHSRSNRRQDPAGRTVRMN